MFPFRDNIPAQSFPLVTYAIIAVNGLMLFSMMQHGEKDQERFVVEHGFIPARIAQLSNNRPLEIEIEHEVEGPRGMQVVKDRYVLPPNHRAILFTILSSMFMHGGIMHLVGNMWFLWLFGDNVEDRLGRVPFVLFYLLGGAAAVLGHWMNDPHSTMPVVGASGAVSAILGAYLVTWPHARIRTLVFLGVLVTVVEIPAVLFLGGYFLMQIFSALQPEVIGVGENVAWWAHIGGFVAGAVLMPVMRKPPPDERFAAFDAGPARRLFGDR